MSSDILSCGVDLAGYMPIRRDFDIEHDNEAEHLLTGVEFLPTDFPAETAMKLSVVRCTHTHARTRTVSRFPVSLPRSPLLPGMWSASRH